MNTLIRKSIEHFYTIHAKKAENFSLFVIHKHTVKYVITPCIPKLL